MRHPSRQGVSKFNISELWHMKREYIPANGYLYSEGALHDWEIQTIIVGLIKSSSIF